MGGYGSTRWRSHTKALTPGDCLQFPVSTILGRAAGVCRGHEVSASSPVSASVTVQILPANWGCHLMADTAQRSDVQRARAVITQGAQGLIGQRAQAGMTANVHSSG